MTSRKSFTKLLKLCIKENIWSLALSCLATFFSMVIYAALTASIIKNRFLEGSYTEKVVLPVFRRNVYGESNYLLIFSVMVVAVIIGISSFSYLSSKQKVDLYHSIPVKRQTLFAAHFVSGVLMYIVPYVVCMILSYIVGIISGYFDILCIKSSLIMLLINLLGFLAMYVTSILAVLLTGKVLVSIVATGTMFVYGPIICSLIEGYEDLFFLTYSRHSELKYEMYSSPAGMYLNLFNGMNSFKGMYELKAAGFIVTVLFICALTLINVAVYKLRASEAAGKSIAFSKIMPVVSVMVLVAVALVSAMGFQSVGSSTADVSYGWLIFGIIFGLAMGHVIVQSIYYCDFKAVIRNLINPAIAGVIVAVVLVIFAVDIFGYDDYFPSNEKLSSTAIGTYGLQNGQEYFNFDNADLDEYGNSSIWVSMEDYRLEHMTITDNELIKELYECALSDTRDYDLIKNNYEEQENHSYMEITVKYTLANGRNVYRSYWFDPVAHADLYACIYENEDYKKGVFDILTTANDEFDNLQYKCPVCVYDVKFTKEQTQKILDTYREELLAHKGDSFATVAPIGYLYQEKTDDGNGYVATYSLYKGYVYPSFTKTIALLNEYGVDVDKYTVVDNVESIVLNDYNYDYARTYDHEANMLGGEYYNEPVTYTDRESIEAIMDKAYAMEMVDENFPFMKTGTIGLDVKFIEKSTKDDYTISYYFINDDIPEVVKNR